jgi:hypothetical protein
VKTGATVNVAAPEKSAVEENVCAPLKVLAAVSDAPPIFEKEVAAFATSERLLAFAKVLPNSTTDWRWLMLLG